MIDHDLRRLVCVTSMRVSGQNAPGDGLERLAGKFTSCADLADALVRGATEDRNVRRCIDVVTTQGAPSYVRVFLKEALHIGK